MPYDTLFCISSADATLTPPRALTLTGFRIVKESGEHVINQYTPKKHILECLYSKAFKD